MWKVCSEYVNMQFVKMTSKHRCPFRSRIFVINYISERFPHQWGTSEYNLFQVSSAGFLKRAQKILRQKRKERTSKSQVLLQRNLHQENNKVKIREYLDRLMHQSIETPALRAPGHSGGLTRPKPGFNVLLTARRPRGAVHLTKCL